jgi:oligopeptide/dipeptide ABC transporter ATP-binding protein
MNNLLEVKNLRCAFAAGGETLFAVRGIDLTLKQGEILGIVGESGSGKTLTMRSIIQILPPRARMTADKLSFAGEDLLAQTERSLRGIRGRDISMVFQDPMTSLDPLVRIGSHVEEVLLRHTSMKKADARKEAVSLLRRVGIRDPEERAGQYPHELSGGMRQRVLIAMALACRPKLLIADEPTTALDVTIQAQILQLIRSLQENEGMTVALITHDMGVVAGICHRVAVMYAGLIMEEGPVDDMFSRPLHPYTIALLGSVPVIHQNRDSQKRLHAIPGQPPSIRENLPGCPFAPRCPSAERECIQALPEMKSFAGEHKVRCFKSREQVGGL